MSLKLRFFTAVTILTLVVSIGFNIALALTNNTPEPGSDQDPVVSKSYVDDSVGKLNQLIQSLQTQVDQLKKNNDDLTQRLNTQDAVIKALQDQLNNGKPQTSSDSPVSSTSTTQATTSTQASATVAKGTVNTAILNVRSQANTTSLILARLAKGETVTIVSKASEWYKIKTSKGITGYVLGKYIAKK